MSMQEPPPPPPWWSKNPIARAVDVFQGRAPAAMQKQTPTQYGIGAAWQKINEADQNLKKFAFNVAGGTGRFIAGRPSAPQGRGLGDLMYDPVAAQSRFGGNPDFDPLNPPKRNFGEYTGQMDFPQPGSPYYTPGAEEAYNEALMRRVEEPGMSPEEMYAQIMSGFDMGGGGGGAARPDFSAYRAALTEQAGGLNAQIQAMYNALGEEAGANVGRIQDIYGGAGEGIGNVYDSATGNVADAYSSAQQQAADQMARLGIEAAAPAVIDPMALSQAQAVSGLEQGRASGQAAAERYGASAGGFGSQMAQVAQQQGTEMNAAILASLQNRLAESLAAEQTGGGGGGGGGMSVRDQIALREYADSQMDRMSGVPTQDQMRQEQWGYERNFELNQAALKFARELAGEGASEEEFSQALELATSILTR